MRILLLGYGKMGRSIESIALGRGHEIVGKIDMNNAGDLDSLDASKVDVAIEFSQPDAAFGNISKCLEKGIPVVSGTTGWLDKKPEIEKLCKKKGGAFFYASNFSIGVNIFFKVNAFLAKMMDAYPEYDVKVDEIHHTEKKDAPSGTAITLAEGVIDNMVRKQYWQNENVDKDEALSILSYREPDVPGTHTVTYHSEIDDIVIHHAAHTRKGFALGAVLVGEWLPAQKGVKTMDDFLKL
ncbi:4-hydroxy-tetrahydrodipicolinate reductase [Fulvitalea axinellae]|uniref:4-hydroxy-tetrahydrodipicolinate reductase n=1 Tax=Fulvitalea axinellae TaxID=1182444 RepID=A0AAU9CGP5_9BACT|nr:4-hydroxy-tetrahydrodipicolinate reductase [Fulvitalea axinellae]